jgi:hypothetical protein
MNNTDETKICRRCGITKPMNEFRKYSRENPNLVYTSTCRPCLNEDDKLRKINAREKKHTTTLTTCEMCHEDKPLCNFAKLKKNYKKKICNSCYPDFLREQKNNWCNAESKSNMNYRIKKSLAARLRNVLSKNDTTMNYIGCNIQYLREWLEYNFTEGMNWENYGKYWSIDHIIPVCKFDLTNDIEKMQCWNWTNLMPVTVNFNSSKKNIDMEQINYILQKIEMFKEEGSTTKWFSEEFALNMELVERKNLI